MPFRLPFCSALVADSALLEENLWSPDNGPHSPPGQAQGRKALQGYGIGLFARCCALMLMFTTCLLIGSRIVQPNLLGNHQ